MQILQNILQKIEKVGMLSNTFYESSIILYPYTKTRRTQY